MARTKEQKKQLVDEYKTKLENSKAVYIVYNRKLSANDAVNIKKELFDLDSSFNVVKNSMFRIALEETGLPVPDEIKDEAKAVLFSSDKISETAKILKKYIDENEGALEILSGILDKKPIGANQINDLADLPSRDVMIAQVLGTMQAPISGFVRVLSGNTREFMNVLNAIKDKKEN